MNKKLKRWIQTEVVDSTQFMRVVYVCGTRQCGKSTLVGTLLPFEGEIRSLDDPSFRDAAISDPIFFLRNSKTPVLIDEIQKVPLLIDYIKMIVDQNDQCGQFILTGSSDVFSLPSVHESLAGRIAKIRLRTLTQGEVLSSAPNFFCQLDQKMFLPTPECFSKALVSEIAIRGGYPAVINFNQRQRTLWHQYYLEDLLSKDLKDIADIRKMTSMDMVINILYAYSSKFFDLGSLTSELSIDRKTFETYYSYFKQMYLFDSVEAWAKTDYQRVTKQKKIFATDTGLMSSKLGWNLEEVINDKDRCGKLIETYVYNELVVQCELIGAKVYHYRDKDKREIDFIVERKNQTIGIEVKASETVRTDDLKHLRWFNQRFFKDDSSFVAILFYCGNQVLSFGNNYWALPISVLW